MKNSFFPIIILFEKAVKEIQHGPKWKFVAKNYVRGNFFSWTKTIKINLSQRSWISRN